MTRLALLLFTAAALAAGVAEAAARSALTSCNAPPALTAIAPAEARIAARIDQHKPLTIVAIGSSSTEGIGASAPQLSYPSRLEAELKARFPAIDIRVINRGKGGEDIPEELRRLDRDVIAEHPELVIWQVGTNAVLRRDDLTADRQLIERGIARLKQSGSDVVLIDMQYAPRVLARPAYAEMEELIMNAAERADVGLFHRFDVMRFWQVAQHAGAADMIIGPDGLHMTDRGYDCLAVDLAEALARNWRAQRRASGRQPGPRLAGLARPGPAAAARAHGAR